LIGELFNSGGLEHSRKAEEESELGSVLLNPSNRWGGCQTYGHLQMSLERWRKLQMAAIKAQANRHALHQRLDDSLQQRRQRN
jgi:hypothetical protein